MLTQGVLALVVLARAPYPYHGWECTFPTSFECGQERCRRVTSDLHFTISLGDLLFRRCQAGFCETFEPLYETDRQRFTVANAGHTAAVSVSADMSATAISTQGNRRSFSFGHCEELRNSLTVPPNGER